MQAAHERVGDCVDEGFQIFGCCEFLASTWQKAVMAFSLLA